MSSNFESMEITDGKSKPKGFFLTLKMLLIIGAVLAIILVGVILATHFGTKATYQNQNSASTTQETTTSKPLTTISTTNLTTTSTTTLSPADYRLPRDLDPYFYELEIQPFIGTEAEYGDKAFTFRGTTKIHMYCNNPTNKIVFHAVELNVNGSDLRLYSEFDNDVRLDSDIVYDEERQWYTVNLNEDLLAGINYTIVIPHTGKVSANLDGFYRGSYVENGTTFYMASTQFEPADARKAFPCFDEPAIKAKYQLTMIRHAKNFDSTLFNTPLISKTQYTDPEWSVDKFEVSVKMSTYLVAYIVSNFKKISMKSPKYGVEIEVAGRPEAIDNGEGDFALKEAAEIIDYYSDYFNISYPLQKSSQVSIPDFSNGAMENWGLVFYRESALMYNNVTDAIGNKRRVSLVIAHELAHQWYGNLVTMNWWTDIWLNEGFASWVENLGMNKTHPEWNDLDYFFISRLSVMVKDSFESSHPVSQVVNKAEELGAIFDGISYDKGASIIRMMNAFLTENTFKKGVSNYLKRFQYDNTVQDDLWEELTKAGHEDKTLDADVTVKDIMDTWTLQKGYPVVQANRNGNRLTTFQKWFLLNPLNSVQNTTEYEKYQWYVPITYTTKNELNFGFETRPEWLKPNYSDFTLKLPSSTTDKDWIIVNLEHAGFYRVNYDEKNWNLLIDQLKSNYSLIDSTNRAVLLDDSFNLGRAEVLEQTKFLDVSSYLVNEIDPAPFEAAIVGLEYIKNMLLYDNEASNLINKYYENLMLATYNRLNWSTDIEDANEISLQTTALRIMCRAGYKPCINQTQQFYTNWTEFDEPIPSDFKSLIFTTMIESGDDTVWQNFYQRMLVTENSGDKLRMIVALCKSKDLRTLKFFLEKAMSDETIVKKQDKIYVLRTIGANPNGHALIIDYIDQNWDNLLELYASSSNIPRLIVSINTNINTQFDIEKLVRLQEYHPNLGPTESAFREAIETGRTNIRWMDVNKLKVIQWLESEVAKL